MMLNFFKKIDILKNKLKRFVDRTSQEDRIKKFGRYWQNKDYVFYEDIYKQTPKIHEYFQDWMSKQNNIQTVMDVGCGAGVYGRTIFKDIPYEGIDISEKAIELAKSKDKSKNHSYKTCDFISGSGFDKPKFDLVFSLSTIDHVYDPDEFLKKCIRISKKVVFVAAYWGYFPKLKSHQMEWHPETTCYQNKLSIRQLQYLLDNLKISYSIEPLTYEKRNKPAMATIIKVEKI